MNDPPTLDSAAVERLRRIGGTALARQMIALFLELGPARMAELEEGVDSADAARVERAAHTLKSTAGNVGAIRLQELATVLEELAGRGEIDVALSDRLRGVWADSAGALRSTLEEMGP